MYYDDHPPAHFHVEYADDSATMDVETMDVETMRITGGHLSPRVLGLVTEWGVRHRELLRENFRRVQELGHQSAFPAWSDETMIKRVVDVRPLGGHRLFIRFDDGVQGEVDVASFVRFDGVLEPLRDPARFAEAYVDLGTVCWPNDLDLAPELLYEKVSGRPLSV